MKRRLGFVCLTVFFFLQSVPVFADAPGDMMSMLESMKQQMAKMQETIDQQNLRLQQLESKKVLETPQPGTKIGPEGAQPYLTENDWQKGIKDNSGEAIPWLKGAKYGGDFRLRYEALDYFDRKNDAGSVTNANGNDRNRNRFRIRLRWGFEKDYSDDWKVGFRLATGQPSSSSGIATDNTAPNQTLGSPGYSTFKNIWIDRAYANYAPKGLKDYGIVKGVTIGAGKFENPFLRYSTTMVWDPDVTPEGAYEKVNLQFVSAEDTKVNAYGTFGQFLLNEGAGLSQDTEMYGYQGALNVSTYGFHTDLPVDITGVVSYYDYPGWSQTVVSNTAGVSYLRTNTIVADNFRVLDIYPELQFYINRTPVTLWYDYATNVGSTTSTEDIAQSLGNNIHDKDQAWGFGAKLGKAKKKGDWEAFYGYWEIGANSVVAAFNDSDFGGPAGIGATNRKGHKFSFTYKLTDSIDVNWTGYVVRPLNPSTLVANSSNEVIFRSQTDVVYRF